MVGGYGLVQWTPKSSLIEHVNTLGLGDYTNGDVQCACILSEVRGTPASVNEWYSTSAFISNYYDSGATQDMIGITGSDFLANTMGWAADKMAVLFMAAYERPSRNPSINHVEDRKANALYWFNYMGGYIPPEPPTPQPVEEVKKENFPWVLYTSKLRGRRKYNG